MEPLEGGLKGPRRPRYVPTKDRITMLPTELDIYKEVGERMVGLSILSVVPQPGHEKGPTSVLVSTPNSVSRALLRRHVYDMTEYRNKKWPKRK